MAVGPHALRPGMPVYPKGPAAPFFMAPGRTGPQALRCSQP